MEMKIKKIHTWNYLNRILKPLSSVGVFFLTRNDFCRCEEGRFVKINDKGRPVILFFNNIMSSCSFHDILRTDENIAIGEEMRNKYNLNSIFIVKNAEEFFGQMLFSCYEKPEELDEMYKTCLSSNPKILNPIFLKYGIDGERSSLCKFIFLISKGSANFIAWSIKNLYNHNINIQAITHVFTWINKYSNIINKLSKGTITAYNNRNDIKLLFEEMSMLRHGKRVNDSINQFNTNQKRLLKNTELKDEEKDALAKMRRLSPIVQTNFVRKMSTIEDVNEIFAHLHHLVNTHFKWNKESFIDYVLNGENLNSNIVYDKDNIVIVEIKDYETIKRIAKNSNWCISKNRAYWENYINDRNKAFVKQFVMCDFSKREDDVLSMIGFTINKDRITAAHNFINDNMLRDVPPYLLNKQSFIYLSDGIYKILNENNISLNDIIGKNSYKENVKMPTLLIEWDKEHILKFFLNMINKGKTIVLKNNENKLILLALDFNIHNLYKNINKDGVLYNSYNYIFGFDFSKQSTEDGSIQIFPIRNFTGNNIEYIGGYNQKLNDMNKNLFAFLLEENIPLNIIPACSNKKTVLETIIINNLINELDILLDDKEYVKLLNNMSNFISTELLMSICDYGCYDLLKCFYKHNIKLGKILTNRDLNYLIHELFNRVCHNRVYMTIDPEDEKINMIWNYDFPKNIDRRFLQIYGFATALIFIAKHEGIEKDIYSDIFNYMTKSCPLTKMFCILTAKTISLNKLTKEFKSFLRFAVNNNINEVFDILEERNVINKVVLKNIIDTLITYGGRGKYNSQIARFQTIFEKKYGNENLDKEINREDEKLFTTTFDDSFLEKIFYVTNNRNDSVF